MKLFAPDSKHSLSTLTKKIRNLALNHRRARASLAKPALYSHVTPTTFPRFFDLPPEIRLLVYEQYFGDSGDDGGTLVAPKSHPTSWRVYDEALPVMYSTATMTIDLNPKYHVNRKDYAYLLEHTMPPGFNFAGKTSQLLRMRNIHLTLGPCPLRAYALRLPGEVDSLKWWQYIIPLASTTSKMFPDFTLAIHIGDITTVPPTPPAGLLYRSVTFATFAARPYFREHGWRDNAPLGPERRPPGAAKQFRALPGPRREVFALATLVYGVGVLGERVGREMSVENHERTKKKLVLSDKLPDLVDSARRVVGEGKEKGVWLVLGDKKKSNDVAEGDGEE